jgi:hypothetical protein
MNLYFKTSELLSHAGGAFVGWALTNLLYHERNPIERWRRWRGRCGRACSEMHTFNRKCKAR